MSLHSSEKTIFYSLSTAAQRGPRRYKLNSDDKYHELDKQITAEIAADMRSEGIRFYPVVCPECRGHGIITNEGGTPVSVCPVCHGSGIIEVSVT